MIRTPVITQQLIFIEGSEIRVDRTVLNQLINNFDPDKKLSVQVAAGSIGTGKSSHQNAIIKYLRNEISIVNDEETPFSAIYTPNTLTQGVWVCLTPLFDSHHPDTQILIMDLEGMNGVKRGNEDDIKLTLMKIYLFGMLISSVFTLHTGNKPDSVVVKILEKSFEICEKIRSKLQIQPPKIFMLMKDIDDQECEAAIAELRSLVREKLNGHEQELAQLSIRGKEMPPSSFISSKSKDCRDLVGTPFLEVIRQVVKSAATNPKYDPASVNLPIKINDFCKLVDNICALFNESDFESRIAIEIDYMKFEKMNEIYQKHVKDCFQHLKDKAESEPLTTSPEKFKDEVDKFIKDSLDAFVLDIDKSIKTSKLVQAWTLKHKGLFTSATKSLDTINTFISRKIAEEKNETLKKEYETQLQEQKAYTESATKSFENIQKKLDDEIYSRKIEKEELEKQWQAQLNTLAQKLLEEQEKGKLATNEHNEKLRESEQKQAEQAKNWSQQFEELRRQQDEMTKEKEEFRRENKELAERLYNERSNHTREVIEGLHQQMQQREASFQLRMKESAELHSKQVELLNQQISVARSNKEKRRSDTFGFIAGIFTNPLATLATGIVNSLLPAKKST